MQKIPFGLIINLKNLWVLHIKNTLSIRVNGTDKPINISTISGFFMVPMALSHKSDYHALYTTAKDSEQ